MTVSLKIRIGIIEHLHRTPCAGKLADIDRLWKDLIKPSYSIYRWRMGNDLAKSSTYFVRISIIFKSSLSGEYVQTCLSVSVRNRWNWYYPGVRFFFCRCCAFQLGLSMLHDRTRFVFTIPATLKSVDEICGVASVLSPAFGHHAFWPEFPVACIFPDRWSLRAWSAPFSEIRSLKGLRNNFSADQRQVRERLSQIRSMWFPPMADIYW